MDVNTSVQGGVAPVVIVGQTPGVVPQEKVEAPILEQDAFLYYARGLQSDGSKRQDHGTYVLRQFLRQDNLTSLAIAAGRALNLAEITALVYYDGEPNCETCSICDKKFTPIAWLDVQNTELLGLVKTGTPIIDALKQLGDKVRTFGCFYYSRDLPKGFVGLCGCPWVFAAGAGTYVRPGKSCLSETRQRHPRNAWGVARAKIKSVLQAWNEEAAQAEAAAQAAETARKEEQLRERKEEEKRQTNLSQLAKFLGSGNGDKKSLRGGV